MNAVNIPSEITSFLGSTTAVGGIIFLACLLWITWSTGSGYSLRKLIWRIVHGKSEILDIEIKELSDQQESLMYFKHINSLRRVRTLKQVHRIKEWLSDNDESASTLRKLGDTFDYDLIQLKQCQTKTVIKSFAVYIVMAGLVMYFFTQLANFFRDGAVITVIKSDQTYAVSGKSVQPTQWQWIGKAERASVHLTAEQCRTEPLPSVAKTLQFPIEDVETLCFLMTDQQGVAHTKKTVREQQVFVAFVAAFAVFIFFLTFKSMVQLNEYVDVEKRQLRRQREKEKPQEQATDRSDIEVDPDLKD